MLFLKRFRSQSEAGQCRTADRICVTMTHIAILTRFRCFKSIRCSDPSISVPRCLRERSLLHSHITQQSTRSLQSGVHRVPVEQFLAGLGDFLAK